MRLAAGVEYCGAGYCGWQRQRHADSVQEAVENALSAVASHPVATVCAGRTDAGVHALGQVIHFDSASPRSPRDWCFGANRYLPAGISLRWAQPVAEDFSARYSATSRRYRYLILDSRARSGLYAGRMVWSRYPLDVERMQAAAACFIGEHDFSSFRARECQSRSPVREIFQIGVSRIGECVAIEIEANAFVHHMVRNIAGVLMEIGRGRRPISWTTELLEIRDRARGGITAPAHGLYLLQVRYPAVFAIPAPAGPSPIHGEQTLI